MSIFEKVADFADSPFMEKYGKLVGLLLCGVSAVIVLSSIAAIIS